MWWFLDHEGLDGVGDVLKSKSAGFWAVDNLICRSWGVSSGGINGEEEVIFQPRE
jgi:hypothetical protein